MGWKEWPAWVKGGVIGATPSVLYLILVLFLNRNNPDGNIFTHPYGAIVLWIIIGVTLGGAFLGTLVGWIYGKIRGRAYPRVS